MNYKTEYINVYEYNNFNLYLFILLIIFMIIFTILFI